MASAGVAYVDIRGDLSSLNKQLGAFFGGSKLGGMGKKAGLAIGVGLGAGLAGKALFDLGATFDEQFDRIRVGTGKTGKALDGLEDDFRDVVKSVPGSFGDAGTAVSGLASRLGLTGRPLRRLSTQLLQLSRITKTDVGENVESVTRLFGDWSISTGHQAEALNKLFRIQQRTGLSVSKNARLLVQFGAPLRQLGFDIDEAAAMFGKFEKEGVNLQTILPGFRFGLKNLSAPTKEAGELFNKLGINLKKGPAVALREVFAEIKKAPSDLKANAIAFAVFGKRAGPDMAAAVREGRFEYDDLIQSIDKGKDTIDKAERNTRDFAEQWDLLKKRVFVGLEPLATKVFDTIGDGMERLATADFGEIGADLGINIDSSQLQSVQADVSEATRGIKEILQSDLVQFIGSTIIGGVKRAFQGLAQAIKGSVASVAAAVGIINDLLHLRFGKAWDGVKQLFRSGVSTSLGIFRTMTAPMREIAARVGSGIAGPFRSAWNRVKEIFSGGIAAALSVMRGAVGQAGNIGQRIGSALTAGFRLRVAAIRQVADTIVGIINRIPGRLGDIGAGILRAMKSGLSGKQLIPSFKINLPSPVPDVSFPGVKLPSFAKGGKVKRKTPVLVGEEGPELVKLPAREVTIVGQKGPELTQLPIGSEVIPAPKTRKLLGTDQGRESPRPLVSRALGGLSRLQVPRFAQGGKVKPDGTKKKARSRLRDIWEVAAPYFPGGEGKAMPTVRFPKHIKGGFAGFVDDATNRVALSPGTAKGLVKGKDPAESTVLHEWAHVHQPRAGMERWEVEGGAEAFTQAIAPKVYAKLGLPFKTAGTRSYHTFVNRVEKEKSKDWILRKQFVPTAEPKSKGQRADGSGKPASTSQSTRVPGLRGETTWDDASQKIRRRMRQVWEVAAPYFRASDESMPPIRFPRHAKSFAWFTPKADKVSFGPSARREYSLGKDYAEGSLIHEWAHAFQDPGAQGRGSKGFTNWEMEGGAEAFSSRVAPKVYRALRIPFRRPPIAYPEWTRQVRREKSDDWIMRGQFGLGERGAPAGTTGPQGRRSQQKPAAKKSRGGQPDREAKGARTGKVPYDPKAGISRIPSGIVARANKLAGLKLPYEYGGGHSGNIEASFSGPGKGLDCSASVAYVLGLSARHSSQFGNWGKSGPGEVATYSNAKHVVMSIGSRLFGTGDGTGPHWLAGGPAARFSAPFTTRHTGKAGSREGFDKPGKGEVEKPKAKLRHKGKFSLGQMVSLAKRKHFPDPALAAAIGFGESKGNTAAHNTKGTEDSRGLWQINVEPRANPQYKDWDLSDAYRNATAAFAISNGGKNWKPWTVYTSGAYKTYLGGRAAPLPKTSQTGTPSGSNYADVLALKIDEAGDTPTLRDDRRWINKALRYWRGVYKRNRANNPQRALEARGQIKDLREKRAALKTPIDDEGLFKLDELTQIGTGPNAFNIGGMQRVIDDIDLEVARAKLTVPGDADDRSNAIALSLTDDLTAAQKLSAVWEGLNTLASGFQMPGRKLTGPFNPSPAQTRALNRTRNQQERITLLNSYIAEAERGPFIQGTIGQKIEAATSLASARDAVQSIQDEMKPAVVEGEAGISKSADLEAFMTSIGDLFRQHGSNFKPLFTGKLALPNFAGGGIVPGAKGKPITVTAHGQEIIVDPRTGNKIDMREFIKQLVEAMRPGGETKVVNVDARPSFNEVPADPHSFSRALAFELEAAI